MFLFFNVCVCLLYQNPCSCPELWWLWSGIFEAVLMWCVLFVIYGIRLFSKVWQFIMCFYQQFICVLCAAPSVSGKSWSQNGGTILFMLVSCDTLQDSDISGEFYDTHVTLYVKGTNCIYIYICVCLYIYIYICVYNVGLYYWKPIMSCDLSFIISDVRVLMSIHILFDIVYKDWTLKQCLAHECC